LRDLRKAIEGNGLEQRQRPHVIHLPDGCGVAVFLDSTLKAGFIIVGVLGLLDGIE
jgi:hypothetical protein